MGLGPMISILRDYRYIPQILELAKEELPDKWQHLEPLLYRAIGSKTEVVFVDIREGWVCGYLLASLLSWSGEPVVFISSIAIKKSTFDNKTKEIAMALVDEWGKALGARKILGFTQRKPDAFIKRYNFKFAGNIIIRDIK
jgi:hypothetical protein